MQGASTATFELIRNWPRVTGRSARSWGGSQARFSSTMAANSVSVPADGSHGNHRDLHERAGG
jgi:hypothetical protein